MKLSRGARSASDLSLGEAVRVDPSEVKGPSVSERAMDEVCAVVGATKEAVQQLLYPHGEKAEEPIEGTK